MAEAPFTARNQALFDTIKALSNDPKTADEQVLEAALLLTLLHLARRALIDVTAEPPVPSDERIRATNRLVTISAGLAVHDRRLRWNAELRRSEYTENGVWVDI